MQDPYHGAGQAEGLCFSVPKGQKVLLPLCWTSRSFCSATAHYDTCTQKFFLLFPARFTALAVDWVALQSHIIAQHGHSTARHSIPRCCTRTIDVQVPPSLQNIYKELKSDVAFEIPKHGHLAEWVDQGILLLNTSLTVEVLPLTL